MSWVLVWDLETVPDVDGFARANGIEESSHEEIRAAMGEFPKLMYHSIVCIGALAALWTNEGWRIRAVGASTVGEKSEKGLIESFLKKIEKTEPTLVNFNGNSFDMHVLRYRSMIHSISAQCLYRKRYFHRYSDSSVDICDLLSGYRSESKPRLDDVSRMMGFSGKSPGIDGSNVEQMFADGKINEIADYCVRDVLNTYQLWLRHEYFRGGLSSKEFNYSAQDIDRVVSRQGYALPI